MKHRSLIRPPLPGSTPAPAPLGKSSVYATRVPPHLEPLPPAVQHSPGGATGSDHYGNQTGVHANNGSADNNAMHSEIPHEELYSSLRNSREALRTPVRDIRTPSETVKQRALQEKALDRMTAKLPFELRESVTAVVRMAFTASQRMQEDLDLNNQELLVLRTEVAEKTRENHTLKKACINFREQIRGMHENIDSLKDEISTRQNFTIRNRSAMTRLASTNRMLIDVLDALQTNSDQGGQKSKLLQELTRQAEVDVEDEGLTEGTDHQPGHRKPGKLAPLIFDRRKEATNAQDYEDKVQRMTMFQNDKLRESLLKVAREHYRSTKNAAVLEAKVNELKAALRGQEMANRKLKAELDEMKVIHRLDNDSVEEAKPTNETSKSFRIKNFGQTDQRFQALLDRNVFDPLDGILQLRRILAHMSSAPSSLSLFDMIDHIVHQDIMRIFDADMVCLYLVKPGAETVMHKFTTRSKTPDTIDLTTTRSVAADTIRTGKPQRLNIISNSPSYHPDIDGCVGVVTKRLMSLPLYHSQSFTVLGAVQFLNKAQGKDAFAEVDELFGMIFANQAAVYLSECVMYDAMFFHAQLLQGLLEASTELFSIVPDPNTIMSNRPLLPGEILAAMEHISRDLLKCPHTRAFLVSDAVLLGDKQLVLLQHSHSSSMSKHQQGTDITTVPLNSGIAGYVVTTKQPYLLQNGGLDVYWNPLADLDPLNNPMLTVPLMDLNGAVLGCLQLICGNRSPRMKHSNDVHDFRLLFSQAAHWLTHQMAPALSYLLSFVGRPARHPVATPSRITRSSADANFRPSFLSSSDEAVSQVIASEQGTYRDATFMTMASHSVEDTNVFPLPSSSHGDGHGGGDMSHCSSSSAQPTGGAASASDKRVHFVQTAENGVQTSEEVEVVPGVDPALYEESLARIQHLDVEVLRLSAQLELVQSQLAAQVHEKQAFLESANAQQVSGKAIAVSLREEIDHLKSALEEHDQALQSEKLRVTSLQEEVDSLRTGRDQLQTAMDVLQLEQSDQGKAAAESMLASAQENTRLIREVEDCRAEIAALRAAAEDQAAREEQQKGTIAQLTADLAKKDKIQTILQEQVVKLAGQNLKELNAAIDKDREPSNANPRDASAPIPSLAAPKPATTPKATEAVPSQTADGNSRIAAVSNSGSDERTASSVLVQEQPHPSAIAAADDPTNAASPAPASIDAPSSSSSTNTAGAEGTTGPAPAASSQASSEGTLLPKEKASLVSPPPPSYNPPPSAPSAGAASQQASLTSGEGNAPAGHWIQQTDEQGQQYYYNTQSGESSWELPADANPGQQSTDIVAAPVVAKGDWLQQFDEFGREYWVHQTTGESAWEIPAGDADQHDAQDDDESEDGGGGGGRQDVNSIYATNMSQFSATAGDYTIEL